MTGAAPSRAERVGGWIALGLSVGIVLLHLFGGGPEIAEPLRASDLPDVVRATSWMVWHMVTGQIIVMAVLFAWATKARKPDVMLAATAMALAFTIAGFWAVPALGVGFEILPQSFFFLLVTVAGAIAWRSQRTA